MHPIDRLMQSNAVFQAVTLMVILAQAGAAWWAVSHHDIRPVLLLNAVVAAAVLAYDVPQLAIALSYQDYRLPALVAFEALVLIFSAGAMFGLGVPAAITWLAFAANLAMSIALMAFAWLFRMTRMF